MSLPTTNFDPGFRITRASHVVLTVRDLAASRRFYEQVIGLSLSAEEGDALYFRGVEEACHHSLVLRKSRDVTCARLGLRVFMDADLDRLKAFFETHGCTTAWAEVPHQGRTLHATDPAGTPLEFCATMPVMPRMITKFTRHAGGSALRLDHYQVLTPEVRKVCEFYMAAGFRLSEYIAPSGTFDLRGIFRRRSGSRRRAGQCAEAAQGLYRYVRPDDLALGGLSLPRAARTGLARPSHLADGRCRTSDAAVSGARPLRGYPRRGQPRLETGARHARRCRRRVARQL